MALDDRLWSIKNLEEQTRIPRSWWYQKTALGLVPVIRIGKYLRFRPSEIAQWLEAHREGPPPDVTP